ncbi:MAG: DUF2019 domain-containing protein [Xanthobacteraceae bacterium]|nr:DUF2019 domain-containing protein [Xanthobacteraceae bacterium]
MRGAVLSELNIEDLVERFVQLSLQEDVAANVLRVSLVNRLVVQIHEISKELARRPGDQRLVLTKLFSHPNLQVRFNVATNLFSLVPAEARRQIEEIADSKVYPIAGHAGTYLLILDGPLSN